MKLRLTALSAFLCLAAFGFGQTPPIPASPPTDTAAKPMEKEAKEEVLKGLQDIVTTKAFVPGIDFSKWPTFLDKHRADIDKADSETSFVRELNKVLRDFGISHITLRTPRAASMRQSGTTTGTGMSVKKIEAGLEVTMVLPQGPAGQVGIEVGDVIKEVEHKPAVEPTDLQVEQGKTVAIKVVKKNGETKDLTLENKTFSTRRPETLTWIGEDSAVLKIWTFANGYDRKNVESLVKEATGKAKFLVIDLRSNGGGAVANLNHFLSLLMPDATPVGAFVGRSVADEYAKDHKEGLTDPVAIAAWNPRKFKTNKRAIDPFIGRIAVLLNRGSASASEICGAALRECRDAVLVGAKSRGAVLASVYGRLPGGFELQYPVQDYVSIKGMRLEGHPLEPDLAVERSADGKDDAPDKAIELLKKKAAEHSSSRSGDAGHRQRAA